MTTMQLLLFSKLQWGDISIAVLGLFWGYKPAVLHPVVSSYEWILVVSPYKSILYELMNGF